jgi:glycosyltransferase involved in cell wall biosynthesis
VRIAVFHNRYAWRGGEDRAVDLEIEGLRKAGHEVSAFLVESREIRTLPERLRVGWRAAWNAEMAQRALDFLEVHPVDVAHVHNFFPLLSPAVHAALRRRGVPVVQTLHNYRLVCANGLFLRAGLPCEDCVARGPWNAVRHACYRGSRLQTLAWARAASEHRRRGLWTELVARFVAPSRFLRRKLVAAGLPAELVADKPNAVPDPGAPRYGGRGGVYVGRLSPEKGVRILLEAWRELRGVPLAIVGAGPDERWLRTHAAGLPGARLLGALPRDGVERAFAEAAFAVAPSLCYENFPLAVAEAFAAGRPVVAPHGTALADLVEDGRTGLLFERGSAPSLAAACRQLADDPALCEQMGRAARAFYEEELLPERSTDRLLSIYRSLTGPGLSN